MYSNIINPFQKNVSDGVSIVTALKNRQNNFRTSLDSWLKCKEVDEIIVVDWSSDISLRDIIDKCNDGRIFLFTVENQDKWILSHAFNLGFRLATKSKILKLDADVMINPDFFSSHSLHENTFFAGNWRRARNQNEKHLNGILYMYRSDFFKVNGYSEYIKTYGWDDTDLYARLTGMKVNRLDIDNDSVYHIPHESRLKHQSTHTSVSDHALSNLKTIMNKYLAEDYPWSPRNGMMLFDVHILDDHSAVCRQYGEDLNIVPEKRRRLAEEKALDNVLANPPKHYGISMLPNELKQLTFEFKNDFFSCWHRSLIPKAPSTDGYVLIISLYNEKTFPRIRELITCLQLNLSHPMIDQVHVVYDTNKDDQRNPILTYLMGTQVNLTYHKGRPTFNQLFELANESYANRKVIIANADIYFNHTLSLLKDFDFTNKVLALTRYDVKDDGTLKLLHTNKGLPNYLSQDTWIFKTPLAVSFDAQIELGTYFCDSFLNKLFFNDSDLQALNPCLDIQTCHLQQNESESNRIESGNFENEKNSIYERQYKKLGGIEPVCGIKWTSLKSMTRNLSYQHNWSPNVIILQFDDKTQTKLLRQLHTFFETNGWNLWVLDINLDKAAYQYIQHCNGQCNLLLTGHAYQHFRVFDEKVDNLQELILGKKEEVLFVHATSIAKLISYKKTKKITKKPKISVITPAYNASKFIEQAIKSVLLQDYDNYEHIIVDGGSNDGTVEILTSYPHLIWISEQDEGQSDAMNKGFAMASGQIIVYLNADDYFLPHAFSTVVPIFEGGADFVVGNVKVLFSDHTVWMNRPASSYQKMLRHWQGNAFCVNPVGYFYRREVQTAVGGFSSDNHFAMDLEFLLSAGQKFTFNKVNEILGVFRMVPGTKTMAQLYKKDFWGPKTFSFVDLFQQSLHGKEAEQFKIERQHVYAQKSTALAALEKASSPFDFKDLDPGLIFDFVRSTVSHICGPLEAVDLSLSDAVVTAVVNNGGKYILPFVEYYKNLGFKYIILLDLKSEDDTIEIVRNLPEVVLLQTSLPPDTYLSCLKMYLTYRFGRLCWTLNVEIDEYLAFPNMDECGLPGIIRYLNEFNYHGLPVDELAVTPSANHPLFGGYSYDRLAEFTLKETSTRESVIRLPEKNRIPLLFLSSGCVLTPDLKLHFANICDVTGALVSLDDIEKFERPDGTSSIPSGLLTVRNISAILKHAQKELSLSYLEWSINYLIEIVGKYDAATISTLPEKSFPNLLNLFRLQEKLNKLYNYKLQRANTVDPPKNVVSGAPVADNHNEPMKLALTDNRESLNPNKIRNDYELKLNQLRAHYEQEIQVIRNSYSWRIGSSVINLIVKLFYWTPIVKKHL